MMAHETGARLIATRAGPAGREYPLGILPLTIGREDDCDIVIDSPVVSRHHARIEPDGGEYRIADAGATNGLFVNGSRVEGSRPLLPGDKIQVGEETFIFLPALEDPLSTQIVRSAPPRTPAGPLPGAGKSPPAADSSLMPETAPDATRMLDFAPPAAQSTPPAPSRVETQQAPAPGAGTSAPAGFYVAPSPPRSWQTPPGPETAAFTADAHDTPQRPDAAARLSFAGFGERLGSFAIDILVIGVPALIIDLLLGAIVRSEGGGAGLANVVTWLATTLLCAAYYTWGFAAGQTIGCRIAGLRIVTQKTQKAPGAGAGLLRFIAFWVMLEIPGVNLLDNLWQIWDARRQTWHDKLAGTLVLKTEPESPARLLSRR